MSTTIEIFGRKNTRNEATASEVNVQETHPKGNHGEGNYHPVNVAQRGNKKTPTMSPQFSVKAQSKVSHVN